MEWISVKDRLPEHKQDVLLYAFEAIENVYYTVVGYPDFDCNKWEIDGYLDTVSNYSIEGDERITHWMPLPKPPKNVI